MSQWVRNRLTGVVHEVPAGHPALSDGLHEPWAPQEAPRAPASEAGQDDAPAKPKAPRKAPGKRASKK